jgi:hypothetical protein
MSKHDKWTIFGLLQYIKQNDVRYEQRFNSQEKAVTIALDEIKAHFAEMNEFRGTLTDQATEFARRTEVLSMWNGMNERLKNVETFKDSSLGAHSGVEEKRKQSNWLIGATVTAIGVIVAASGIIIAVILRTKAF